MTTVPELHEIAIACGSGGAYVEVSDDIRLEQPVTRRWGRDSEFDDVGPGSFAFTLANAGGKYTPGNAATTLDTPIVEGMGVCWQLGDRLVSGRIRSAQPFFLGGLVSDDTARVRIVVDDMLGLAARHRLDSTLAEVIERATPWRWWPLDDAAGSSEAASAIPGISPLTNAGIPVPDVAVFGADGLPGVSVRQTRIRSVLPLGAARLDDFPRPSAPVPYESLLDLGWWGVWITPESWQTAYLELNYRFGNVGFARQIALGVVPSASRGPMLAYVNVEGAGVNYGPAVDIGVPHYYAVHVTLSTNGTSHTLSATPYLDGRAWSSPIAGTSTSGTLNAQNVTPYVTLYSRSHVNGDDGSPPSALFSQLTLTKESPLGFVGAAAATQELRWEAVTHLNPEIIVDTLPAGLSQAPQGALDYGGKSVLDLINDLNRTEQGHVYTATTGTLTAPEQKLIVRERDRTQTVTMTFNLDEINDPTDYIRDLSNTVSTAVARGPAAVGAATDESLIPLVGTASSTTPVLLANAGDLREWAQDRIIRGKNYAIRAPRLVVDYLGNDDERWEWDDLKALVPGDRIRLTNVPEQIGATELEGYIIGGEEDHSTDRKRFIFHLAPVLPRTAIFDTDQFMADGALTLSTLVSSSTTSFSIATSDSTARLETATFPYNLRIDDEIVTVTACTSATPQVATVTRGAAGTTAAAHSSGATVELATPALFAF